jgi:hypothetical protein
MRRTSLLLLLLALAACRHAPPDKEARAVAPPDPVRCVPEGPELYGAWRSTVLRGTLADLGHTAIYVFEKDGKYTGAMVSDEECTPLSGTYTYAASKLSLDGGAIVFKATLLGDGRLLLEAPDTYVELVPMGDRPRFSADLGPGKAG